MGCDIHFKVEHRDPGGSWVRSEPWVAPPREGMTPERESFYDDRDYDLFSVLAGVRGPREPIAAPRGLPDDVSGETSEDWAWWDYVAHSASWFTLGELLRVDWVKQAEHPYWINGQWLDALARMRGVADEKAGGDVEAVRAVFWFDS